MYIKVQVEQKTLHSGCFLYIGFSSSFVTVF